MEMIVFSSSNYHKLSKYNLLCWQQINSNILFSQDPASTSLLRLTSSSPGYEGTVNDDNFAVYCLCETVCVLECFVCVRLYLCVLLFCVYRQCNISQVTG